MKPIPQKELDQGCDLFGRPITVGTKVRSHDFAFGLKGRSLPLGMEAEGERASYIEGVVEGVGLVVPEVDRVPRGHDGQPRGGRRRPTGADWCRSRDRDRPVCLPSSPRSRGGGRGVSLSRPIGAAEQSTGQSQDGGPDGAHSMGSRKRT